MRRPGDTPASPADARLRRSEFHESSREQQIISAALALLQEAEQDRPGLEQLARKVGVNERRLTELFRKQLGMTVAEYQNAHRLERARAKLCASTLQIQRIAEKAGYQNASDFSRAFRQRYGLGPRGYRQASSGAIASDAVVD